MSPLYGQDRGGPSEQCGPRPNCGRDAAQEMTDAGYGRLKGTAGGRRRRSTGPAAWWGWRDSKPQKRWSRFSRTFVPMRVHGPLMRLSDFGTFRPQRRETHVYAASLSLIVLNNTDHDGDFVRDTEVDSRVGSNPRSADAHSAPNVAHRDRSDGVHDRKRGAWVPAHGTGGRGCRVGRRTTGTDRSGGAKYFCK